MSILLNKKQRYVMQAVFDLVKVQGKKMVSLDQLMNQIPYKLQINPSVFKAKNNIETNVDKTEELLEEKTTNSLGLNNPMDNTQNKNIDINLDSIQEVDNDKTKAKTSKTKRKFFGRKKAIVEQPSQPIRCELKEYKNPEQIGNGLIIKQKPVTFDELQEELHTLMINDYFELTEAIKDNEKVYIFELLHSGLRYDLEAKDFKKRVAIKIITVIATSILSFIIGMILKSIFK